MPSRKEHLEIERSPTSSQPTKVAPWESLTELGEYRGLVRSRLDYLVEVREPFVLISQIQRSGGTLLNRLFDGHPQCHVHPFDLRIGHPRTTDWPQLDLEADPRRWFEILYESRSHKSVRRGLKRTPARPFDRVNFPICFLPRLQHAIFEKSTTSKPVTHVRDVFDSYFTSYFNAWLDNHNLYTGPKKVVTGFAPRLSMNLENLEGFFTTYPEGTLISIVRDPRGWYASASKHRRKALTHYRDPETALALWRESAEAAIEARRRFGERVVIITYEDLVQDTHTTMAWIADRLGIAMMPSLMVPTENGQPKRADSSEPVTEDGVLASRATAFRRSLDADTIARVEQLAGDLYERASAMAR